MVKAKKFILQKHFDGFPKKDDLKLVEEDLPPLKDGEFLAKAIYLSVDPYQRIRSKDLPLGTTFIGRQIAKIIESKNKEYPVGTHILGDFGWRNYTISTGEHILVNNIPRVLPLPDFEGLPLSLGIGVFGSPGLSAFFGFLEICHPKEGETVVVTGAAGAVGSIVGQIAKIKGCTVVGVAGSEEKGKWLVEELGFDAFVNYKDPDFAESLRKSVPSGVDCYFDNVGGKISSVVINLMNTFGRISVCGSISAYNEKTGTYPEAPLLQGLFVGKQLKMEGFTNARFINRRLEGIEQLKKWVKEGKLIYRETITEGFENMFEAFVNMLQGGNFGKAIVKV